MGRRSSRNPYQPLSSDSSGNFQYSSPAASPLCLRAPCSQAALPPSGTDLLARDFPAHVEVHLNPNIPRRACRDARPPRITQTHAEQRPVNPPTAPRRNSTEPLHVRLAQSRRPGTTPCSESHLSAGPGLPRPCRRSRQACGRRMWHSHTAPHPTVALEDGTTQSDEATTCSN